MFKPELLLPAGSIESFFAAINGGADAVYLGLKKFNARNRAKNFSFLDLLNIINEAHAENKKIYITLNTLIKNEELHELVETLYILSQYNVDAVIIQDLAIYNLVNKYFKNIKIHSSTQMAVHNSLGCNYFEKLGFERVILARELTKVELSKITSASKIQKEIFIHGSLCYSLSGHCLFSSYLGGNSANRGLCAQVCRRNFLDENSNKSFFSLKDFQLIDLIPLFSKLEIASLKVEGRMKSPEYIYNTAKAYRIVIDDHSAIYEAKKILMNDFAREKTMWFMGESIENSITSNTGTGVFVGKIEYVNKQLFKITSNVELNMNSKLRSRNIKDTETEFIKIHKIQNSNNDYLIYCNTEKLSVNDEIYLVGNMQLNFKPKFSNIKLQKFNNITQNQKSLILNSFTLTPVKTNKIKLFLRISRLIHLKKLNYQNFEAIYLRLRFKDLEDLFSLDIKAEYKQKLHVELPKYISETKIHDYKNLISKLFSIGFRNFVISHISQIDILPKNCNISCNENIYLLNDISINFIQSKGIKNYCYPLENDYPNLLKGKDRNGIVPIYFYPELFYSRMPINTSRIIKDENNRTFNKSKFNGFTIITDKNPVSITHNINKFRDKGFYKFLIDLSLERNDQKLPYILNAINKSEKIKGSNDFNMKKGLH